MARTKQITNHRTGKRAKTEFQHQTIPAPQPDPPAESPPPISFPTGPPCKRSALGNLGQAVLHFPPTSAFGPVFIDNQGVQHLDFPELDWGNNTDWTFDSGTDGPEIMAPTSSITSPVCAEVTTHGDTTAVTFTTDGGTTNPSGTKENDERWYLDDSSSGGASIAAGSSLRSQRPMPRSPAAKMTNPTVPPISYASG